ncbi:PopZ family protein [Sinorhizobium sp. BG8]|uniref:PopZ family protein n=1 Tax=Sinorhizobium sp. BG8 TaxID=2613773 RepID=UPI00193CEC2C|nr:PopZ family protein [Sinorhizobium sp. BG8]QRM55354.1 DUF2497 domain-containing protein [Sinorhizobium sp. BG8]
MAQPNVAREPSMDEILASIRKIIENNEAQPDLAPDADMAEDVEAGSFSGAEARLDAELMNVTLTVDDESGTEKTFSRVEISEVAAAQPALSLADVAARVRAASERNAYAREPEKAREIDPPQAARSESPLVTSLMGPQAVAAKPADVSQPVHKPSAEASFRPELDPVVAPARSVPLPIVHAEPEQVSSSPREPQALISPAVGERVAQSFGTLAQAIDSGPRRSFDEIAEEMLRPMLQEWLDDNLPTLVERLVREEIERVARGPRR